jgi:alpha-ketoglutarate-dependent taurine dioxygenase
MESRKIMVVDTGRVGLRETGSEGDLDRASEERARLQVEPLSGTIGAVIRGVDLRNLSDETVSAIRQVWIERKVVFFPDQHLDDRSHLDFSRRFGELTEGHPVIPAIEGQPHVHEIDYTKEIEAYALRADTPPRTGGLGWHTDVTFMPRPPAGSILNALDIPRSGGDTLWSDQQSAFDDLSPMLQAFLSTLHAVHDGRSAFQHVLDRRGEGRWEGEVVTNLDPVVHPVVRTHPETGQKVLFVNPGFTSHIVELQRSESDALLAYLYAHSVRSEYTVRYHWTAGDIGFWDNRSTQHSVVGDYGKQHRRIHRVTLRGDAPA